MKYFLSSVLFLGFLLSFQVVSAATTSVTGCTDPTFLYSPITGQKCPTSKVLGAFSDVTDANSTVRLRVTKVECDSEADLPNLGAGDSRNILTWDSVANGPQVTANSGWKWISGSNGKCHFEPDVYFEWATTNSVSPYTTNPGNNLQSGGSGWATFGPSTYSGVAEITVPLDDVNKLYWVREKVTSNYLPFSGSSSNSNSAELYCNFDIHNISSNHGYDNFSKVYFGDVYYNAMQSSPTWYKNNVFDCVAFNAPPVKVLNPSVTVLSPNGGEVYEAGQQITVKWKTTDILSSEKVVIVLDPVSTYDGDGYNMSGSNGTINDGTETFTLNSSITRGNFTIRVLLLTNNSIKDSSDNFFTIQAPTPPRYKSADLKINGSDNPAAVPLNSKITASWTSTGTVNCYTYGNHVPLWQSTSLWNNRTVAVSGSDFLKAIWLDGTNDSSPSELTISIQCFESNGDYITDSVTLPLTRPTIIPTITVLSPNGGEIFTPGQKINVTWQSSNIPNTENIQISLIDTISSIDFQANIITTPNDGQETFTLPTTNWDGSSLTHGTRFKIGLWTIRGEGFPVYQDLSDNLFTINSSSSNCRFAYFAADSYLVNYGDTVTLSWDTLCKNVGIENMDGFPAKNFGSTSSTNVSVYKDTTFTMYVSNDSGCLGTVYSTSTGSKCNYQTKSITVKVNNNSLDSTPRIMYWYGKVNQHVDVYGVWQSDPDGTSGANLDKLTYCRKWYPNTTSVASYKSETINTWRRAMGYEQSGYTNTVVSDKCIQDKVSDPYVKVLSPNGGEKYTAGQQITVKWETAGIAAGKNVKITLIDEVHGVGVGELVGLDLLASTPNDGVEVITLPSNRNSLVYLGNYYKIRVSISPFGNYNLSDASDKFFSIESSNTSGECPTNGTPLVQVLSPNGGEEYEAGQQVTIKWKSCGISSTDKVRIDLVVAPFPPGSTNGVNLTNTVNDGSETITLPSLSSFNGSPMRLGKNFKINIWQSNYSGTSAPQDLSDNLFTIKGKTSKYCPTSYPAVRVISPNGGEKYKVGQKIKVKWNPCNVSEDETVRVEIEMGVAANDYSSSWFTFLGDTLNDGEETFTVPAFSNYGELFRVLVSPLDIVGSNGDRSDNSFTINKSNKKFPPGCTSTRGYSLTTGQSCAIFTPIDSICGTNVTAGSPYIAVVSPNGGEVYQAGKDITVKWVSCNISSDELLEINFYGGGTTFGFLRPNGTPNDGTEVISTTGWGSGTDYKIIVGVPRSGFNNSALSTSDQSDRTFSVSTSTLLPGCTSTAGYSQTTGKACNGSKVINTSDSKDFVFYRGLKYGLTGDDVIELQKLLLEKGLYIGPITGYFGPMTADGVKKFQAQNGFTADGIVGSQTLGILNN